MGVATVNGNSGELPAQGAPPITEIVPVIVFGCTWQKYTRHWGVDRPVFTVSVLGKADAVGYADPSKSLTPIGWPAQLASKLKFKVSPATTDNWRLAMPSIV